MEQREFKQKVLPLRQNLLSYANYLLENADDAEDIIQEVFLKLWYIRSELKKYDNISALSVQITKNLCINRLKVLQRKYVDLAEYKQESDVLTPYLHLEQKDNVERVMSIISGLPELQQAVLRMKHIDGFEVEEIAEITGSSPDAVRMNLSRARKKVRNIFFNQEHARR